MPTVNTPGLSLQRIYSYVNRLPLFTRLVVAAIVLFEAAAILLRNWWDVRAWGALAPDELGFGSLYRTNTYPLIHTDMFHLMVNLVSVTPMLDMFEREHGTLTTLALFIGPLSTLPALLYVGAEKYVLGLHSPVMGASIWAFLLAAIEAVRMHRVHPYFVIAGQSFPVWATPLAALVVTMVLWPKTSGLGLLKYLAPPEKVLRWIEGRLNLLGRLPHYYYGTGKLIISATASALQLRRDPRILKLPPYLSLLCIVVGVAWLLLLPLDQYSRRTYISENALLPGQVHTYFSGSDQNVFRAYKHEVNALVGKSNAEINDKLEPIVKGLGLKTARQNFTYHAAGHTYSGENLYAILQAPRGDATEAIVLVAAWENVKHEINRNGVPLALTLLRYFKRWSLWSKDIILVLTPDSIAGPQAWVDAYHDAHDPSRVASLPLKAGLLQGAIAIDYAQESRFDSVHIVYDGVNGQLPNLDLINSVVHIAGGQMGIGVALQEMWRHDNGYSDRLRTMLRGMLKQGLGLPSGPHSSFIPYHVDAVTLQPFGEGWQDEMAMGRVIEGTFRSLNNLLEHLHQSFFFYLIMHRERFVSIGTYLPSAMLVAANFTIMAIALWVKSGQAPEAAASKSKTDTTAAATATPPPVPTVERDLFLPLGVVALIQSLSIVPLYLFNHAPESILTPLFIAFTLINTALPSVLSHLLAQTYAPTAQQYQLVKSFSLLLLGMFLSSLATLNFSLALLTGLLAAPLSFAGPCRPNRRTTTACRAAVAALLHALGPPAVLLAAAAYSDAGVAAVLREAAVGWHVCGTYSPLVVWCVWWPAWLATSVVVLARGEDGDGDGKGKGNGKVKTT
ncbi:bc48dce1-70fc-44d4-9c6d-90a401e8039b [Thermothielavioides terrestris]|uniref:Bc48dce1-70fc-44d4-9c6d-90a401e8039b n=1 Tax=Thermothielavioides terrestris TaxID=2587410 RepID=A0A3S4AXV8_9PEZI|nr:bc48dce1-70fc-44d4-9c6d-90a401e8039b [Thermothielavioides terrestris]